MPLCFTQAERVVDALWPNQLVKRIKNLPHACWIVEVPHIAVCHRFVIAGIASRPADTSITSNNDNDD
jgi:hypothetical protein